MIPFSDFINKHNRNNIIASIERNYPGVNTFMYMAHKWSYDVDSTKDRELYNLLMSLKHVGNIESMTEREIRKVYKFIIKRRLRHADYDDFEDMFLRASDYE